MGGTGGAGVISHPYIATQSRSCTLWNDSGERFHGRAYGFDKFAAEPVVFIASVCDGAVGTRVAKLASGDITTVVTPVVAKGKTGMEAWLSSDDSIGAYGTVTGWPMRRRA